MQSSRHSRRKFAEHEPGTFAAVERALIELVQTYARRHKTFSAWDCHCLGAALSFLRFGYYEQAQQMVGKVADPPALQSSRSDNDNFKRDPR
jgi:hypothetical protein